MHWLKAAAAALAGVALVANIHVSDSITLGSLIVGALVGVAGLATFGYGLRWKSNYETERASSAAFREGREAFKLQTERIRDELAAEREHGRVLNDEKSALSAKVAALEALPDLSEILHQIGENAVREDAAGEVRMAAALKAVSEMVGHHDERATERQARILEGQKAMLNVLELIAGRLGSEPHE